MKNYLLFVVLLAINFTGNAQNWKPMQPGEKIVETANGLMPELQPHFPHF